MRGTRGILESICYICVICVRFLLLLHRVVGQRHGTLFAFLGQDAHNIVATIMINSGRLKPQVSESTSQGRMQFSDTHTVSRKDFEEFGCRIGLSPRLVHRELDFFVTEHPLAQELISRSFLSEQLKRYYWQSYNYRRTTLTSH